MFLSETRMFDSAARAFTCIPRGIGSLEAALLRANDRIPGANPQNERLVPSLRGRPEDFEGLREVNP